MSGFTPGPWLVNPVRAWIEVPGRDAPICAMAWPTELRSEDETFANARLIAAAPDLLTIAERLLDRGYVSKHIGEEHDDHMQLVAAIAKAKGGAA